MNPYLPIAVTLGFAVALATGLLVVDSVLGPKRPSALKMSPYECGMPPVGTARERFHAQFFLVALLFILFDVEIVFFYLWVYAFHQPGLMFLSLMEVALFLIVLTLGLGYAWAKGALQWD